MEATQTLIIVVVPDAPSSWRLRVVKLCDCAEEHQHSISVQKLLGYSTLDEGARVGITDQLSDFVILL